MLNIPPVGLLPGSDKRVTATIDAISRELGRDGFVSRYSTAETDDGLPGFSHLTSIVAARPIWAAEEAARNG